MRVSVSIAYDMKPKQNTIRTQMVKDAFGIDFEVGRKVIVSGLEFDLEPGQIVYATGASGAGKTSICREIAKQIGATDLDTLTIRRDVPLVDVFPAHMSLEEIMGYLSSFGLAEAHVALRTYDELSQGQQYRALLAYAAATQPHIFADEFCAKLDRVTAKSIAYNLRKRQMKEKRQIWIVATTHRDIEEDLQADILIDLDAGEVKKASRQGAQSVLLATLPLPTRPKRTGRISLGGII